jgi:alkanesulfonate monooxygenase SsuD/methylene tetrahydromethanopterin reductase-like flavin-dependent oxidoreductase (luciferase family)
MLLLPQHDIDETSLEVATLLSAFGDRLDLGVALGYRDEEFDVVGVPRPRRGRLMDSGLDRLLADHGARWPVPPPVWVGGVAEAAVRRAGARGLSLLLPNSMRPEQIVSRRGFLHDAARSGGQPPGRVGMLVDTWITAADDTAARHAALERVVRHHREYTAAWFTLEGQSGFERPELMDKQSDRTRSAAVIGPADHVLERLRQLRTLGVDAFVLNVRTDFPDGAHRRVMRELAESVLPALRADADAAVSAGATAGGPS